MAVSGGADSVVLLDLFARLQMEWQWDLSIAHFNHRLRGKESDEDQVFVEALGTRLKIPVHSEAQEVTAFCRENKLSIETGARELRYHFLERIAQEMDCQRVATGHTANDQAETVLDWMMRGAGVSGLAGIPIIRDRIIRPLLFATRAEILAHADGFGLAYREDSTNLDLTYRRNRIRHILLPLIKKEFNPRITSSLNRLSEIMTEVDSFLYNEATTAFLNCLKSQETDKIILDIIAFLAYFTTLQKYVLRHALEILGEDPRKLDFRTFDRILVLVQSHRLGKEIRLDSGMVIRLSRDAIVICKPQAAVQGFDVTTIPGRYPLWQGMAFEINSEPKPLDQLVLHHSHNIEWVDAEKVTMPLHVRTFREGDHFHPLNLKGSKKLSDFFIDEKVPFYLRQSIPILECKTGIVWVGGYRLDDRYKVSENTKRVLRLALSKES